MKEKRRAGGVVLFGSLISILAGGTLLHADERAKDNDIAAVIEARQEGFEKMGAAMKVFRNELRSDSPDNEAMKSAADVVASYADQISGWFPAGSGPESGLETDALSYIWKNTEKFSRLSAEIVPASTALVAAVSGKDQATIISQVGATGKACKSCHDSFRAD